MLYKYGLKDYYRSFLKAVLIDQSPNIRTIPMKRHEVTTLMTYTSHNFTHPRQRYNRKCVNKNDDTERKEGNTVTAKVY